MAERTWRPSPPGSVQRDFEEKTVAEQAADLSDKVLSRAARRKGYSVSSTTLASGAFFCTDSMPLSALALVL
jgi:hypothetical protein